MRLSINLLLLITLAVRGQTTCPRVVPEKLDLIVPATLPPGSYPYLQDTGAFWVFCDSASVTSIPVEVTITGPLTVMGTPEAWSETSESYLWPTFLVNTMTTAPGNGTQQAAVTVAAGGRRVTLPVTVTYAESPFIHVEDSSMGFDLGNPQDKKLTLWFPNATTAVPFNISTENAPWLSISPPSGSGYAQINAHANLSGLSPGSYFGSIVITAPGAVNSPVRVPVRVFLPQRSLATFPGQLKFSQVTGGPAPPSQTVQVQSREFGMSVAFTASTDVPWLSVTPTSGTANAQATVSVSANGAGVAVGTYYGNVIFKAADAILAQVPVTLTILAPNSLVVSPDSFSFFYWPRIESTTLGGMVAGGTIKITSTTGSLKWQASKQNNSSWLGLTYPDSGTTPTSYSFSWGLPPPGTYTDAIVISSDQANNSPQIVPVSLKVLTEAPVDRTPDRLDFESQHGAAPSARTVAVSAVAPTAFTVSASSTGDWLSVSPAEGTTPASLTVSVRTAGMATGNYAGTLTIHVSQPDGSTIPVGLVVILQIFP